MGKAGGLPQSETETAAEAATVREGAGFKGKDGGASTPIPPCLPSAPVTPLPGLPFPG